MKGKQGEKIALIAGGSRGLGRNVSNLVALIGDRSRMRVADSGSPPLVCERDYAASGSFGSSHLSIPSSPSDRDFRLMYSAGTEN